MTSVASGLADYLAHPPLGLLGDRRDENGPHAGNKTLTTWSSTLPPVGTQHPVSQSYGCIVTLEGALPAAYSFTRGWTSDDGQYEESVYRPRICQLVAQHQLIGGNWVSTTVVDVDRFPMVVTWSEVFPGRIGLLVQPGLEVDLRFLVLAGEP